MSGEHARAAPVEDGGGLLTLAERCEAARGPDRELDQEVYCALGICAFVDGAFNAYRAPAYTASLDAAMTLLGNNVVGEPLGFKVERLVLGNGIIKCRAVVWCGLGTVSALDTVSEAATPALALTAACLRALTSSSTKDPR